MEINWLDAVPLLVSVFLGGLIGLERQVHDKPAGLRTNILICLGSCVFTIISTKLPGAEPGRIAAQIVTGIGFLGAGAIIQSGASVHGLTTSACIWIVASIGMACGTGMYFLALIATILTLIALMLLSPVDKRINRDRTDAKSQ